MRLFPYCNIIEFILLFIIALKQYGYIDTVLTVDELLSQSEYDLFVKTSIPGHSLHHLLPRIVVVTYVNVDIHSTCLIMTLSCLKSPLSYALYTNLSHLTTNLLLYVLFCVFPVCYDVRLSHLNKYYLLTYLLISNVVPAFIKFFQSCHQVTETRRSIVYICRPDMIQPRFDFDSTAVRRLIQGH